jgi:hypothetical protein
MARGQNQRRRLRSPDQTTLSRLMASFLLDHPAVALVPEATNPLSDAKDMSAEGQHLPVEPQPLVAAFGIEGLGNFLVRPHPVFTRLEIGLRTLHPLAAEPRT